MLYKRLCFISGCAIARFDCTYHICTRGKTCMIVGWWTRPDTRPIPVADGWAGGGNACFHTFQLVLTDGPTDQRTDGQSDRRTNGPTCKGSYSIACLQLKNRFFDKMCFEGWELGKRIAYNIFKSPKKRLKLMRENRNLLRETKGRYGWGLSVSHEFFFGPLEAMEACGH